MSTKDIQRVHRINRPLVAGETVSVPCVVDRGTTYPVLWPAHRDTEDGQPDLHYHLDDRFIEDVMIPMALRLSVQRGGVTWRPMVVLRSQLATLFQTSIHLISNAINGIPCNRIVNGRCPHKGFNLAQVEAVNGVITCPMHGMRFNSYTGKGLPYRRAEQEGSPAYRKEEFTEEELWLRG